VEKQNPNTRLVLFNIKDSMLTRATYSLTITAMPGHTGQGALKNLTRMADALMLSCFAGYSSSFS
jgi:hypothetical protein